MFRSNAFSRNSTRPSVPVWLLATVLAFVGGCHGVFGPLGGQPAAVPPGYVRARIQVQLPPNKLSGMTVQATNDLRNQTIPAKMRLTVNGMDLTEPIEPTGNHVNPIPLSTQTAEVSMLVRLGRNLVIKAEGLTADNKPIPSAVVKGVFDALVDGGTVDATANRLTTPIAEVIEGLLAKQHLGPEEQKRSRNLLLSYDTAALQQFVLKQMLGATGNLTTDLQRFNEGKLLKHPGLINSAALGKYVWERADVPPNANFLVDEEGRPAFLTPGKVKGTVSGLRPGTKVTILCDDPVSKPTVVEGATSFEIGSVLPGQWRVHAHATGYRPTITHYTGGEAPAFYEADDVPSGGERVNMDFAFELIPPAVDSVYPTRGPFSPDLSNPAYVTIQGQDFGDTQDNAVVVFRNNGTGTEVSANLIELWSNGEIRVAVPTLTAGEYTIRIDKPALVVGEMIKGLSTATYAAGSWRSLFTPTALPFTLGGSNNLRLGVASNDDLHAKGHLFASWNSMLGGLGPTPIILGTGGMMPATVFDETNTATPLNAAWALHPDGRSLYVWAKDGKLQARAFGVSGVPLGTNYDLVDASANASDCNAEGAVFDREGMLHLAYSNRDKGIYYRRFQIDGLGVGMPVGAPLRVDEASAIVFGSQDAPRLRVGRNGHALLAWTDRRLGNPEYYLRVIKPDGQMAAAEQKRPNPFDGMAIDSAGNVAITSWDDKKLARYSIDGTMTGEITASSYSSVGGIDHDRVMRLSFDDDDRLIAVRELYHHRYSGRGTDHYVSYRIGYDGYVADGSGKFVSDSLRPLHYGHVMPDKINAVLSLQSNRISNPVIGHDGTVSVVFYDYFDGRVKLMQYGWY